MDIKVISELIGIILIVCWAAKQLGIASKFIPMLALILGGFGAFYFGSGSWLDIVYGVFTGLGTTLGFREVKDAILS